MKLSEINPYVRFARIERKSLPTIRSAAIDHRIFVCLTGSGLFSVGGKLYTVSEGTLIYIRSGVYYFVADEEQTISFRRCPRIGSMRERCSRGSFSRTPTSFPTLSV